MTFQNSTILVINKRLHWSAMVLKNVPYTYQYIKRFNLCKHKQNELNEQNVKNGIIKVLQKACHVHHPFFFKRFLHQTLQAKILSLLDGHHLPPAFPTFGYSFHMVKNNHCFSIQFKAARYSASKPVKFISITRCIIYQHSNLVKIKPTITKIVYQRAGTCSNHFKQLQKL